MPCVKFCLESYVDDVFGGATPKASAENLKSQLIEVGSLTTANMNLLKCKGPAQVLTIIGHRYNALTRRVKLPVEKQQKYLVKLRSALANFSISSRDLQSLVGSLVYAS